MIDAGLASVAALVALALGIALGLLIARERLESCQASCAEAGLLCAPRLRDGRDYCVPPFGSRGSD